MDEIRLMEVVEQPVAAVRARVPVEDLSRCIEQSLRTVLASVSARGARTAGPPFARYRAVAADAVDVEIGFPVDPVVEDSGEVISSTLPAARVVEAIHRGPYDHLAGAYAEIERWMFDHHLTPSEEMWEVYEAGPESDPDPNTWRTRIVWPTVALMLTERNPS
ncbi:GyrI-like domain-containing protein [Ruania alkalisoli]|uniref:GyrI-like domain-containing protein n=1 Tax=Ruania alkalisoli TaxID=2779775 RepID=A0A7M1T0G9_9MICO|nr:GyrI-like domain-containing protein [Ruania alkalisoli]QOR72383.1 GyrI-like domain-containing protein [Ruania alkalisoli]